MKFCMEGSYGKVQGSPNLIAILVAALYAKEIAMDFSIPIEETKEFEKCLWQLIKNSKESMAFFVQGHMPVYFISEALKKSKLSLSGLVPSISPYSTITIAVSR